MAECTLTATGLGHFHVAGKWLFRGLDLQLRPGETLAILAPNGRGKSTLLSALSGGLEPREGRVEVTGSVALVPAAATAAFDYSVLDMVMMGRARHVGLFAQPGPQDVAAARESLSRFGLSDFAERSFSTLSGGERQLVLIARAVASEARVLLLDEPTASLDMRNQGRVVGWIRRLALEGLAVAFTTHDPSHAAAVADEALLLLPHGQVTSGPADAVLTGEGLSALFGCEVQRIRYQEGGGGVAYVTPI